MIEELENIKLIRELSYLKSDFEYKSSLMQIYNIDFLNSVENILKMNLDLKSIYDEKKNLRIGFANNPVIYEEVEDPELEVVEDVKIKSFFRQIVKLTHPDKVKDDSLNLIYNQATSAFKDGKKLDMILLCEKLNIPFEIGSDEKELLKNEIQDLKNKISLLESSYSYQWANVEDDSVRNKIAINYIKTSIS